MPATTLVPGYKQVDAFGPDEDYLDTEEVSYVTLDLGVVEPTLLPSTSTYRLIGLDTPTPFLQLSGSIFKGRHDTLLGTELLFTEEKNDMQPTKFSLVHAASAEQRIRFKEVQLKEKARPEPTDSERRQAELLQEVESMYVDADADRVTPSQPEQSRAQGTTEPASTPPRKKKRKSRKGKERANMSEEDTMDMT